MPRFEKQKPPSAWRRTVSACSLQASGIGHAQWRQKAGSRRYGRQILRILGAYRPVLDNLREPRAVSTRGRGDAMARGSQGCLSLPTTFLGRFCRDDDKHVRAMQGMRGMVRANQSRCVHKLPWSRFKWTTQDAHSRHQRSHLRANQRKNERHGWNMRGSDWQSIRICSEGSNSRGWT